MKARQAAETDLAEETQAAEDASRLRKEAEEEPAPPCELCQNETMSVKQLLIECPNLNYLRIKYLDRYSPLELEKLLSDCQISNNFILFLNESGIFNRV